MQLKLQFTAIALLFSIFTFAQSSLVLHYPINQETVNQNFLMEDKSGNANHCEIIGELFWDDDSFGNTGEAIMIGDWGNMERYITAVQPLSFTQEISDFTLAFWSIRSFTIPSDELEYTPIFDFKDAAGDGVFLRMNLDSEQIYMEYKKEGNVDTYLFPNEFEPITWEHYGIVYDAHDRRLALVVNGLLVESFEDVQIDFPVTPTLQLGKSESILIENMNWCYDEIRLYNSALTLEEMSTVMMSTTNIEVVEQEQIRLFPNPVGQRGMIQFEGLTDGNVRILDQMGRTVGLEAIESGQMSVQGLSGGTYYLQFMKDEKLITRKLLIQP